MELTVFQQLRDPPKSRSCPTSSASRIRPSMPAFSTVQICASDGIAQISLWETNTSFLLNATPYAIVGPVSPLA